MSLSVIVNIGATLFQQFAVGDTIQERFQNIVKPPHVSECCWMGGTDDEQFRAAVGGLLLSYPEGSTERAHIEHELGNLRRMSALLEALSLGLSVDMDTALMGSGEKLQPIGLLTIWTLRQK